MKKMTLVIMAAGIGSRFGQGIKQLTSFGPSGEIIMHYSIYDAIEAGFEKVVFVIRRSMLKDFKEAIGDRVAGKVETAYVFQELEDLPEGFEKPDARVKPWGTGQAILACRDVIDGPFAVINADDYYGKDAFRKVYDYLSRVRNAEEGKFHFCMAGFRLNNTLSEHGGVTRGICSVNADGELISIAETRNIIKTKEGPAVREKDGTIKKLAPDCLVSMNFWGFTPDFIEELAQGFSRFLETLNGNELTAEYLLPMIIDRLLKEERVELTVLGSRDRWFGITFQEDVPIVRKEIGDLIAQGVYPADLFGK